MLYRRPRFRRVSDVSPMQLTERDLNTIRFVCRHRFLRSTHIAALAGGSSQHILRRLQLLYHHGYLERPHVQLDYYHQGGTHPMVYGLGEAGGRIMRGEGDFSTGTLRIGEKNRSIQRPYLEHVLLVSDVMVAIELACRRSGRVKFLPDTAILPPELRHPLSWDAGTAQGRKLSLAPDRVFALECEDGDGNPSRVFFFLEADMGTMPVVRRDPDQTCFFRKLLAYAATWTQDIHRTRLGFHRFRVLTVTRSAERVGSIQAACRHLPRGQGLFLFADRSILENPDLLFAPIWRTPDDEMTSIISPVR